MDVVGHQSVTQHLHLELLEVELEQAQIKMVIVRFKKYVLSVVPTLRDVMRYIDCHRSGVSRHVPLPLERGGLVRTKRTMDRRDFFAFPREGQTPGFENFAESMSERYLSLFIRRSFPREVMWH